MRSQHLSNRSVILKLRFIELLSKLKKNTKQLIIIYIKNSTLIFLKYKSYAKPYIFLIIFTYIFKYFLIYFIICQSIQDNSEPLRQT